MHLSHVECRIEWETRALCGRHATFEVADLIETTCIITQFILKAVGDMGFVAFEGGERGLRGGGGEGLCLGGFGPMC